MPLMSLPFLVFELSLFRKRTETKKKKGKGGGWFRLAAKFTSWLQVYVLTMSLTTCWMARRSALCPFLTALTVMCLVLPMLMLLLLDDHPQV